MVASCKYYPCPNRHLQRLGVELPGFMEARGGSTSISQSVHTAGIEGDFSTFNFTGSYTSQLPMSLLTSIPGSAVSICGPVTTLSTPMLIVLDGNIKFVAPPNDWGRWLRNTLYRSQYRRRYAGTYAHYGLLCCFRIGAVYYQRNCVRPFFLFDKGVVPDGHLFCICMSLLSAVVRVVYQDSNAVSWRDVSA